MDFRQIPAFCINLDARSDRWARVTGEFARIGWSVTRARAAQHEKSPYPGLSAGHAGCLDSHKALWQRCVTEKLPVIAVFEDDAVFPSDFIDIFPLAASELPPDWELWHLHATRALLEDVSEHLVRITGKMWGSHGYLVTAHGCEKLIELSDTAPVDLRMSKDFVLAGGQAYGMRAECALAFQQGDDTDIPQTAQLEFWRQQRARFCR